MSQNNETPNTKELWTKDDALSNRCLPHLVGYVIPQDGPPDLELDHWTKDDVLGGRCESFWIGKPRGPVTPRPIYVEPVVEDPLEEVLDIGLQLFYDNPARFIADHPSVYIKLLSAEMEAKAKALRAMSSYSDAELELLPSAELQRLIMESIARCPNCSGPIASTEDVPNVLPES